MIEIREVMPDERAAAFYCGSQAFMHGSRDMSRMDHPDRTPRTTYGVWDDGGLQSVVSVLDFRIHLRPQVKVPMGGVAAVSCLPASRGKGYAEQCLKHSIERMRDRGQIVSTLFPFSFAYYERLGWAWSGVRRTYEVKTSALQPAVETESVRAATEADRPAIMDAYECYAGRYRGPVQRTDKLWNQLLNSSETEYCYTYVYEHDGRTDGYLTYKGGMREHTRLRELVALTPAAQRGLLGLLRRHAMQMDKISWEAPGDDALWLHLMHWDLKTTLEPATMSRIVDVPAALQAWRPNADKSGRLVLAVRDELASWNNGKWSVEFAEGDVKVSPTSDAPQVSLDIGALSQAYFGTPTVADIRSADRLIVTDEPGYSSLAALLDGPPMWMNDSF